MSKSNLLSIRNSDGSVTAASIFSNKIVLAVSGILLALIILALLPVGGGAADVPTYTAKRGLFKVTISESGEIAAVNAVSVSTPRIRGELKIVYLIDQGTYVEPGDTLCRFDPTEALNKVKDQESELQVLESEKKKLMADHKSAQTRLETELKSAELSYELSKLNLEQIRFEAEIKQKEAMLEHQRNELSYQKTEQEFESLKIVQQSELDKMNIQIEQKRLDLEKAERDLGMLTLTAPKEGLVVYENNWSTGRKIAVGDTPWGGMTIITLPDLSAMQSKTFVNEVDVSRVKPGQPVEVRLDAFQDSTFTGEISEVASLGKSKDYDSKIKVFEVIVKITTQSEILKPGMTSSNKIIVNEIPDVVYVPFEAVFERDGEKIVYLQDGSGFEEQPVTLAEKGENYIVVTEGVKDGDVVALRDPSKDPAAPEMEGGEGGPGMSAGL